MLMRPDDGAVDEVRRPVDLARRIGLVLQDGEHAGPDPGGGPAPESAPRGTPRAGSLGQVAPRRTGAEHP